MITCDLFLSHNPKLKVRALFRFIIGAVVAAGADVRVHHIPGAKNVFADALSRGDPAKVLRLEPAASIAPLPVFPNFLDGGKPTRRL